MDRIEMEYRRLSENTPAESHPAYERFTAAKQALGWVLNPTVVTSPADVLVGTGEASEGCSSRSHPQSS